MGRRGDGTGREEADGGGGGEESPGVRKSPADSGRGGEGDGVRRLSGEASWPVQLGDDGGSAGGTSEGVEVVGGGVGEEVVEDRRGTDGFAGEKLPLIEGIVHSEPPRVVKGRRGGGW